MIGSFVFLAASAGFMLLLLSMRRHRQNWLRHPLTDRMNLPLRLAGFLFLVLSFVVAGMGFGWAYGAVCWFGWLTVAATTVVLFETNHRRFACLFKPDRRRP